MLIIDEMKKRVYFLLLKNREKLEEKYRIEEKNKGKERKIMEKLKK